MRKVLVLSLLLLLPGCVGPAGVLAITLITGAILGADPTFTDAVAKADAGIKNAFHPTDPAKAATPDPAPPVATP